MNLQEILTFVYTALFHQGCKSVNAGLCVYRGPNGTKCAAGHLIKDEHYHATFECRGSKSIGVIQAIYRSYGIMSVSNIEKLEGYEYVTYSMLTPEGNLIAACQAAHDNIESQAYYDTLKELFQNVADDYDLTLPELVA